MIHVVARRQVSAIVLIKRTIYNYVMNHLRNWFQEVSFASLKHEMTH